MNSPGDRGRLSDDRLRYAPKRARDEGHGERLDRTRWSLSLDTPTRRTHDLAAENIGRSAVERDQYPRFVDRDILELDIRPESMTARRGGGPFYAFVRFAAVASIAAIAALLIVQMLLPMWTDGASDRTAKPASTDSRIIGQTPGAAERQTKQEAAQRSPLGARLVVRQVPPGGAGDAIPLGVSLAGAGGGATVLISGLPAGSTISSGRPLGANNWRLLASDLSNAAILPRRGFVGAIGLAVELRLADDTIADRQSLNLTWIGTPEATEAFAAARTTAVPAPPAPAPKATVGEVTATQPGATPNSRAASPPRRLLNREEIAYLLNRGEAFMAAGDIGPARLVLQRAAEAGDAQAAFALATTYDPNLLTTRKAVGVAPDIAMARAWYEKAKEFGLTDASRRLELLASQER